MVGQGQRLNICISHYVTTKCSYFIATSEIKPGILKPFTVLHKLFKMTFRELFQEMRVDRKIFVFQKCLILCRLKFRQMGRGSPAEELLSAATAALWASTCTHLPTCAPAHLSTCAPAHLHTCAPAASAHLSTCTPAHLPTCRVSPSANSRHSRKGTCSMFLSVDFPVTLFVMRMPSFTETGVLSSQRRLWRAGSGCAGAGQLMPGQKPHQDSPALLHPPP